MSITDLIIDRVSRGMLLPLFPKRPGDTIRRVMLLSEKVQDVLYSPMSDQNWESRIGRLEADLEHFVTSPQIDPKYLFHLYPSGDCIWEIRSVRDDPSIRVLGLFAATDVFVATNIALREDLEGWQSREWREEKRIAGATWRNLFHTYKPRFGTDARVHITGAIDGKYFRKRD